MNEQIILYSSSECLRCRIVRHMLDVNNIEYKEILDDKPLMLNKGLTEVPAMEINGKMIDSYRGVLMWIYDKIGILEEYSEVSDD